MQNHRFPKNYICSYLSKYKPEQILYSHLKYTDNLLLNTYIKYAILPINIYLRIFEEYPQFKCLVIVTDNPKCMYLNELEDKFKRYDYHLEIISNQSIFNDFFIISEAENLLLDLSTFTWSAHLISKKKQKTRHIIAQRILSKIILVFRL